METMYLLVLQEESHLEYTVEAWQCMVVVMIAAVVRGVGLVVVVERCL